MTDIVIEKEVNRSITTNNSINLDSKDIIDLLNNKGYLVPKTADVTFTVPGGAEWSNTTISLDDTNIVVEWTEIDAS
jgi:hypothetical protein